MSIVCIRELFSYVQGEDEEDEDAGQLPSILSFADGNYDSQNGGDQEGRTEGK